MGFSLSLIGCAKKIPHPSWFLRMASMGNPLGPEEIVELPEGESISFSQLMEDLRPSQVVFVGESHDQREHHLAQVRILRALITEGKDVVVAMEMFRRSQQPILDRWSQGNLTEEEFLKEIHWETTWGIDYSFYRDILDVAKEHHLKILCLNVSKELSRKVARTGIDHLPPEDRNSLPEMDLRDREHRRYIRSSYGEHSKGTAKGFEYFYQAQCLWDEAMAETISDFLKSPEGEGKTILVLAGNGHIAFGFGIPRRLHRRIPLPYRTVLLKEWRKGTDEDFFFSQTSRLLADFLWITQPSPHENERPRIGIVLKDKTNPKVVWIEQVTPESPAEKAGLLPGDQFISIDGKEVQSLRNIHDAVAHKGSGREIVIIILRGEVKKEIRVVLPSIKNE
jgi:uncharacterized iron-regulated protein